MIVFQNIFAKELKISKDTIITYTLEDNRKIAILLKQGEYDAALSKSLNNIVIEQDTLIDSLKYTLYVLTNKIDSYKASIVELEKNNKDMIKDIKKYIRRSTNLSKVSGISIGLNIIFIVIFILI